MDRCRNTNCSVKTLEALADNKRLRAAIVLAAANRPLCVCELTDAMGETQYNVSRCLTHLAAARIVRKEKHGRWVMYSLERDLGPIGNFIIGLLNPSPCCPVVAKDLKRLDARLSMRKNGICVVGNRQLKGKNNKNNCE